MIKRQWLSFDWRGLAVYKAVKELIHIMAPAMLSQLLPPVSAILATKLVAGFGAATVAAWALGSRLEFFSLVGSAGINNVDATNGWTNAWP